jgi:predicted dehydrogenase
MPESPSRRGFIKTSAGQPPLPPPGFSGVQNSNSVVHLGWIGAGNRGYYLLERLYNGSSSLAKVTAVCETYAGNLARGKDRVQTMGGNTPKTYDDYLQLLADPAIDAVVIATPEHLHYPMFMAALKAGKNIYVENPLAHDNGQGEEMVQVGEKSDSSNPHLICSSTLSRFS